ncbi:septum formation initiator family protein [Candidatus Microgenomates bacterium]|nr:septum formation initiator family protein [Candidatus Microgenomates bacterium]
MIKRISLGIAILIMFLIGYNLINQISDALKSSERLSQEADNLAQLQAQNRQLKEKLSQIQSEEFIEEQARNKLGLAKAGETVVIIPEEKLKEVLGTSESAQIRLPNWLGWWRLFFR